MNLPKIQITPERFYKIGKYCFFGIAILNLAGLINYFTELAGTEILVRLGSIIFNFALMGFFSYLLSQEESKVKTDLDMQNLAEEFDRAQGKVDQQKPKDKPIENVQ